jgi:hypothetical protein
VQPTDGILVLQNTDGTIKLIGGQGASGFAALAAYDLNGDGVIDASDAVYSQLRVWQDANGNAVADPGELHTLAETRLASARQQAAGLGGVHSMDSAVPLGEHQRATLAGLRVAMTLDPILVEWDSADRAHGGPPCVSREQHPFPWRNSRTGRTIGYGQGVFVW